MILRSDLLRKQLAGVDPQTRLDDTAYAPAMNARVYETLRDRATGILRAGQSVIIDAVFAREDERAAVERLAARAPADFAGIWLEAPVEILAERLRARQGDVSDATVQVMRAQATRPTGAVTWTRIDATGAPDAVRERVTASLGDE